MIIVVSSQQDIVGLQIFKVLSQNWPSHLIITEDIGRRVFFHDKGLSLYGKKIRYEEVRITFNRLLCVSNKQLNCCQSWRQLLHFLEYGPSIVVNRPEVVMGNFFKPLQMKMLSKFFHVPKTFVASNMSLTVKNMVVKSISSVRSIVDHAKNLEVNHALEPILVQRYYSGFHVRLHVIGDFHTAMCIYAKGVDYRYCQHAQFAAFRCPKFIVEKARAFMGQVGAVFSGFDFIVHHGRWICLEANMAPGFTYFDHQSKKPWVMKEVVRWVEVNF